MKNQLLKYILVFILLSVTFIQVMPEIPAKYVKASGTSYLAVNSTNTNDDGYFYTSSWKTWNNACLDESPVTIYTGDTTHTLGWQTRSTGSSEWLVNHGVYGFDISGLPSDAEVTSIELSFYCQSKVNDAGLSQSWAIYEGDVPDGTVDQDNARGWYPGADRICQNPITYDNITASDWFTFQVVDPESGSFDYVTEDSDGWVWFYLLSTNHAQLIEPSPWPGNSKSTRIIIHGWENTEKPELVIYYIEGTESRIPYKKGNAPVDTTITGDEVADNITWQTPRCAYADEDLVWWVNGDSGATITLELKDSNNNLLDEVEDSVRTDGIYEYSYDPPNDYYGWVRLFETTHNLKSTWGYIMPGPVEDQVGNMVYAVDTSYPQYDYPFNVYLTYEDDPFVLHYKTNIQTGEHEDHDFNIYSNGDSDNETIIFNQAFDWLNDNYFGASENNSFMNHWRYIIFTPNVESSGFEDCDGLIYDLDYEYTTAHAGFLQAKILDTTDNSTLANSHSCYWYIPKESDGVIFDLDRSIYRQAEPINVELRVGMACRIKDNLYQLKVEILDDTESVIEEHIETYNVGTNEFQYEAPVTVGTYELRFTFSSPDISWSYIHDEQFGVSETAQREGPDSIINVILDWIKEWGLNSTIGYWVLLLIGMVALFLLAYRSPVMRVALPLTYLGLFMVWQLIDSYYIILLALGAGLTLYGIFRRRYGGKSGGDGEG